MKFRISVEEESLYRETKRQMEKEQDEKEKFHVNATTNDSIDTEHRPATRLEIAIKKQDEKMVEWLLSHKNIELKNQHDKGGLWLQAMHYAAMGENIEILKRCYEKQKNDDTDDQHCIAMLAQCIKNSDALPFECKKNDTRWISPIDAASVCGNIEAMKVLKEQLIQKTSNSDEMMMLKSYARSNVLLFAIEGNQVEMIEYLLKECGLSSNQEIYIDDECSRICIEIVKLGDSRADMLEQLLEKGLLSDEIDWKCQDGNTAHDYAENLQDGNKKIKKILDKHKTENHDNKKQEGRSAKKVSILRKLAIAGCHLGEIFSLMTVFHAGWGLYSSYLKDLSMWQGKKYSHDEVSQVNNQSQNCNLVLFVTVLAFSASAVFFTGMQNKLKESGTPSP